MEFEKVVKTRRSVRAFATQQVSDEIVSFLVECAVHAPSSMNGQPWKFIVIRDSKTKQLLARKKNEHCPPEKAEYTADFLKEAPVIIVTCVEKASSFDRELENGVLATAHLLLAAASRGLTGVYLSAYKEGSPNVAADIRQLLGIPETFDPVTIVPVGYPATAPAAKKIKTVQEVLYHEAFGRK